MTSKKRAREIGNRYGIPIPGNAAAERINWNTWNFVWFEYSTSRDVAYSVTIEGGEVLWAGVRDLSGASAWRSLR